MDAIRYTTTDIANTVRIKNFGIGSDNTINYGPTSTTGFYSTIDVPSNGYVVYANATPNGPNIWVCDNDSEFILVTNRMFGNDFSTVQQCIDWFNGQTDRIVLNGDIAPFSTDGLVMYIDSGIVMSYPRSGTSIYDLSGENNTGTLVNSPTFSTTNDGIINFNGTNQLITFSSPTGIPVGNSNYTISVWFRADVVGVERGFIGWGNYGTQNQVTALRLATFGFRHYWWANDLDVSVTLTANTWYNVVARFDGTTRDVWLNNVQEGSDTPTGHNVPNANNLTFARTNVSPNFEYFDGDLSNILIYNRAITDEEIGQNWDALRGRYGL